MHGAGGEGPLDPRALEAGGGLEPVLQQELLDVLDVVVHQLVLLAQLPHLLVVLPHHLPHALHFLPHRFGGLQPMEDTAVEAC